MRERTSLTRKISVVDAAAEATARAERTLRMLANSEWPSYKPHETRRREKRERLAAQSISLAAIRMKAPRGVMAA